MQPILSKLGSGFFLVTGFIACPCHLPLTLPLVLALTAGTALGAFLTNNVGVVFVVSGTYFVGAMLFVARGLWRGDKTPRAKVSAMNAPTRRAQRNESPDVLAPNVVPSAHTTQSSCCAVEPLSGAEVTHG
jgi:mercuric ion transport protein